MEDGVTHYQWHIGEDQISARSRGLAGRIDRRQHIQRTAATWFAPRNYKLKYRVVFIANVDDLRIGPGVACNDRAYLDSCRRTRWARGSLSAACAFWACRAFSTFRTRRTGGANLTLRSRISCRASGAFRTCRACCSVCSIRSSRAGGANLAICPVCSCRAGRAHLAIRAGLSSKPLVALSTLRTGGPSTPCGARRASGASRSGSASWDHKVQHVLRPTRPVDHLGLRARLSCQRLVNDNIR